MVPFEDAARVCEKARTGSCGNGGHVLVVRIANPREGAEDADRDSEVGDHAHNQHGIVIVLVVNEDKDDTEDEPDKAGGCTS